MRALRASPGYVGCTLRIRFPSLMCEMRSGATVLAGRIAGKIGRESPTNKLRTPLGSPPRVPGAAAPGPPIYGGASSPSAGMPVGVLGGAVNVIGAVVSGGVPAGAGDILIAVGASKGWPQLIGVEI